MEDAARLLTFLNTLVVSGVEGHVQAGSPAGVAAAGAVRRVELRAGDLEGLTIEEVRFGLRDFSPPSESSGLAVRPTLDHMVVTLSLPFWRRAADLTGERILAGGGTLLDRILLEGLEIDAAVGPRKVVRLEVRLRQVTVLRGDRACCEVSNLKLVVEGLDVAAKDRKKALSEALVYLDSLDVRVHEDFLNRAIQVGKRKAPRELEALSLEMSSRGGMIVRGALKKLIRLPFGARLSLASEGNLFRIYFHRFFLGGAPLPSLTRTALLKLVQRLAARRPEVEATDHYLFINPWPRLPVPIRTRVLRFLVADGALVVTFGPEAGRSALADFSPLPSSPPEPSRPELATVKRRLAPPGAPARETEPV